MSKWKSVLAIFLFYSAVFHVPVLGDGPTCSQMGTGPDDMIMESPGGSMAMNPKYQWDKRGSVVRVPIVIDHAYSYKERGIIFGGLQEIASKTCVKFAVHKESHQLRGHDYVYVSKTKSKGCWSYVGRVGGKQDLSLPIGCINHRTVVHEVMHALGFSHEHVRHDRDNFVEILWGNIQRGRERNFEKKHGRADPFGPYDYESIMHYERNAFSTNGHDTIRTRRGHSRIGRGKHMSHWDTVKINRMYKCGGGGGGHSPFFGFGGLSGHPGGGGDDEVSFDDGPSGQSGPGPAALGESEDDDDNDVFSSIDNDPAFEGLFPSRSPGGRGPPSRGPPRGSPPSGPFSRRPYGAPPGGHPGPRGVPPLVGPPLAGPGGPGGPGPDYDDSPRSSLKSFGEPQHSFPDNPFAKIPDNPFSPRQGLPSNAVDDSPPVYYDTPQESKDYNYHY